MGKISEKAFKKGGAFVSLLIILKAQFLFAIATKNDTVTSSLLGKDSVSYEIRMDSLETKIFYPVLGPITISNTDTINYSLPLPAGAGPVTSSFNIPVNKLYQASFDPSSPDLPVMITNTSNVSVTGGSMTILGTTRALQDPFPPGASQVLFFPTSGQTLAGFLNVSVTETSVAAAGKGLALRLTFNGLIASSIRCKDSLISFEKTYTNDYGLTDSLDVDYIDMASGFFQYLFRNYANIPLQIQATQLHLWDGSWMSQNGIWKFKDLSKLPAVDSLRGFYYGNLTLGFIVVNADSMLRIITTNLAGLRLFPIWNDTLVNANGAHGKSVSRVVYTIRNLPPKGDTVTISAYDSMAFTIMAPNLKFKELYGTVKCAFVRGDTAKIQVPFPFNKSSKDSLNGHFVIKDVRADIHFTPVLPDSTIITPRKASIDTLGVTYALFNPDSPQVNIRNSAKFQNVYNQNIFKYQLPLTNILNQWPDSIFLAEKINISVGTRIRVVTDLSPNDPEYPRLMGRMKINAINAIYLTRTVCLPVLIPLSGIVTTTKPTLKWYTAIDSGFNPGAIGYTIQIDTNTNFSSPLETIYLNDTSYSTSNLPVDTIYWRVKAVFFYPSFTTAYSTPSSFIISYDVNDSRIPKLIPYFPEITKEKKPAFKWHKVDSVSSYTIMISNNGDFSSPIATVPTSDTTYSVLSDLPEGIIYWKVKSNLLDFYSIPDTFTIVSEFTPLLDRFNGAAVKSRKPVFRWFVVPGDTLYKIEIATNNLFTGSFLVPVTDTFYIPGVDLSLGKQYWRVSGSKNYTAVSLYDSLIIDTSTSVISSNSAKSSGPFHISCINDRFIVNIPESQKGQTEIMVFALSGKCVFKTTIYQSGRTIVTSGKSLVRGVYSVRAVNRSVIYKQKIVIQ